MTPTEMVLQDLKALVLALEPYQESYVIVGGIVPLLYRFHGDYESPRHAAQLTTDIDLAVPEKIKVVGQHTLRECLIEAGFVILPSRGSEPPKHFVQHLRYGEDIRGEVYAEFLVPLKGKDTKRDGSPKSPVEVQKGLNAEALRHIDILLESPIALRLDRLPTTQPGHTTELVAQIPSPASYIIQKLLSSQRRDKPAKKIKDLAAVYDVVVLTNRDWAQVKSDFATLGAKFRKPVEDSRKILRDEFLKVRSTEAVAQALGIDPETVQRVTKAFIED